MRVERNKYVTPIIQKLFSENIDFENNIVPDSINGNDASLVGRNVLEFRQKSRIKFDTPVGILDDFCFFLELQGTHETKLRFSGDTNYLQVIEGFSKVSVFLNNISFGTFDIPSELVGAIVILAFRRIADNYTLFANGQVIASFSSNIVLTDGGTEIAFVNYTTDFLYISSFNITNATLSDVQIAALIPRNNSIFELTKSLDIRFHCHFAQSVTSSKNYYYDVVSGNTPSYYAGDFVSKIKGGISANYSYGFDLYSPYLLVPLKYDGTSFNKVIPNHTHLGTVTQNGAELLNCETKMIQPNVQELKDADVDNFYFDVGGVPLEKSYTDLQTAPSYINYVQGSNKITELTI